MAQFSTVNPGTAVRSESAVTTEPLPNEHAMAAIMMSTCSLHGSPDALELAARRLYSNAACRRTARPSRPPGPSEASACCGRERCSVWSKGSELFNWTREWAQARSRLRGSGDALLGRADEQGWLDAAGQIEATSRFQPSGHSDSFAPCEPAPPGPRSASHRPTNTGDSPPRGSSRSILMPTRVVADLRSYYDGPGSATLDGLKLMATRTVVPKPDPVGTTILEELADLDARSLSPETVR